MHRHAPDSVAPGGEYILGGIADQPDLGAVRQDASPASHADSCTRQAAPGGAHSGKGAIEEKAPQARTGEFPPGNPLQVPRHQGAGDPLPRHSLEQLPHPRTNPAADIRTIVYALRLLLHGPHRGGAHRNALALQHLAENVCVEHAVHRDAFSSSFDAGHGADGIYQSLAMLRSGAPHQRAVDIEK